MAARPTLEMEPLWVANARSPERVPLYLGIPKMGEGRISDLRHCGLKGPSVKKNEKRKWRQPWSEDKPSLSVIHSCYIISPSDTTHTCLIENESNR